jgi:hypothetical protein
MGASTADGRLRAGDESVTIASSAAAPEWRDAGASSEASEAPLAPRSPSPRPRPPPPFADVVRSSGDDADDAAASSALAVASATAAIVRAVLGRPSPGPPARARGALAARGARAVWRRSSLSSAGHASPCA